LYIILSKVIYFLNIIYYTLETFIFGGMNF